MERAALVLRILLIAAAFGAWLPGSLWAMDAGAVRIEYRSVLFSGGIDEGNSGGPLVRGQAVVGLVMGVERGFGLAVPAMSLKIFLDSNEVAWATGAGKGTQIAAAKPQPVRPLTPKAPQPRETFRDCDYCPEMVVVPAGSFRMGSLEGEKGRQDDEGPVHQVRISEPFALGRREVTVAEFRAFVEATDYRTEAEQGNGCYVWGGASWNEDPKRSWRSPGFEQEAAHPVVCVSWNDARRYVDWLSKETGAAYRLPSEAEWEYAARAGTPEARFWGEGPDRACAYANVADKSLKASYPDWSWTIHDCDDGVVHTAPVGSFEANDFTLMDMLGNAWEWTADCWNGSYKGAPDDGSAWTEGNCDRRVLRGGSWGGIPEVVRSADRIGNFTGNRSNGVGLRPARTL